MPGNAGLIEPSLLDAIQMIAASEELPIRPKGTGRHRCDSSPR